MSEINIPENDLPPELIDDVDRLIDEAGITHNRALIRRILTSGILLGTDDTDRLDLKVTSAALIAASCWDAPIRYCVELPCGSKSIRSIFLPISARQAVRLMAVVVLPTPPF